MTESGAIEGWPDEDLQATADAHFGDGADSDLPEPVRFLINVVRVIRNRRNQAPDGEEKPAVFFLRPSAPDGADPDRLITQPMLDNGLNQLGGRFWFVGPAARRGVALSLEEWPDNDGEAFDFANEELGVGDLPAVLFEARTDPPQIRLYPGGLAAPDQVSVVSLSGQEIDLDRVLAIVDNAHSAAIVTPQGGPDAARLWQNQSKHFPVRDAEARIQFILRVALSAALPTTVVRKEQSQTSGRIDLEIEEPGSEPGNFIRHALLELKVLRNYGSTGNAVSDAEVREVIKEGLRQATVYRDERKTLASALCCFDMRKTPPGQACFNGVKSRAQRDNVKLCVWPVYASAKQFRLAKA